MLNKRYDGMDGHIQDIQNNTSALIEQMEQNVSTQISDLEDELSDIAVAIDPGTSTPSLTEPPLGLASDIANIGDGTLANGLKVTNQIATEKRVDVLYDGAYTGTAGNISLAHPWTDYDLIEFVYGYSGDLSSASGWTDAKIYPVHAIQKIYTYSKGMALFGYGNRWGLYHVQDTNTFNRYSGTGDADCYVIGVYGIKL